METQLIYRGHVEGLVFEAFGEVSQVIHSLIYHLATSKIKVTAFLHPTLCMAGVKGYWLGWVRG